MRAAGLPSSGGGSNLHGLGATRLRNSVRCYYGQRTFGQSSPPPPVTVAPRRCEPPQVAGEARRPPIPGEKSVVLALAFGDHYTNGPMRTIARTTSVQTRHTTLSSLPIHNCVGNPYLHMSKHEDNQACGMRTIEKLSQITSSSHSRGIVDNVTNLLEFQCFEHFELVDRITHGKVACVPFSL